MITKGFQKDRYQENRTLKEYDENPSPCVHKNPRFRIEVKTRLDIAPLPSFSLFSSAARTKPRSKFRTSFHLKEDANGMNRAVRALYSE